MGCRSCRKFCGNYTAACSSPLQGEVFPSTGANGDGAMETIKPEGPSYKTRFSRFGGLRDFGWREWLEVGPFDRDADGNFAALHFIDVFGAGIVGEQYLPSTFRDMFRTY